MTRTYITITIKIYRKIQTIYICVSCWWCDVLRERERERDRERERERERETERERERER